MVALPRHHQGVQVVRPLPVSPSRAWRGYHFPVHQGGCAWGMVSIQFKASRRNGGTPTRPHGGAQGVQFLL
eukprot:4240774-Pyramimonas_sp.AAC.1